MRLAPAVDGAVLGITDDEPGLGGRHHPLRLGGTQAPSIAILDWDDPFRIRAPHCAD